MCQKMCPKGLVLSVNLRTWDRKWTGQGLIVAIQTWPFLTQPYERRLKLRRRSMICNTSKSIISIVPISLEVTQSVDAVMIVMYQHCCTIVWITVIRNLLSFFGCFYWLPMPVRPELIRMEPGNHLLHLLWDAIPIVTRSHVASVMANLKCKY